MGRLAPLLRTLLSLGCWTAVVLAAPHPHQGVVTPFPPGDPGVKLDKSATNTLASGKPYQTQIHLPGSTSGRGLVVQDVKAPTSVVWDRILDFNAYKKMVPKTVDSEIYNREALGKKRERIWVRLKVGFPVLKLQFFINHVYDPSLNSLTWTLDYTEKSDLDDSCGYWYIVPHPDNPKHWSRVYYSVEVSLFSWVPQFVVDFMSKQALTDATGWVKKQSELNYKVEESEMEVAPEAPKEPNPFVKVWRRMKRKEAVAEEVEEKVVVEEEPTPTDISTESPSFTRVALVTTTLALVLYNIHLFLAP